MNIRIFRAVPAIEEKKVPERAEDRYLLSMNLAWQLHRSITMLELPFSLFPFSTALSLSLPPFPVIN